MKGPEWLISRTVISGSVQLQDSDGVPDASQEARGNSWPSFQLRGGNEDLGEMNCEAELWLGVVQLHIHIR